MIDDYLDRTATLRRPTVTNEYGEPVFEDTEIRVRWNSRQSLRRDAQGNQVTSEAKLYTNEPVYTGDTIVDMRGTDWPVIAVDEPYFEEYGYYAVAL